MVDAVSPDSGGGRFPVKRIAGEAIHFEADVFAKPGTVDVMLRWRRNGELSWRETEMVPLDDFRYGARIAITEVGVWEYAVCAVLGDGNSVVPDAPELLFVEPPLARSGAWVCLALEQHPVGRRALRECLPRVDALKMMGFDIIALPELTDAQSQIEDFDWLVRVARQRGLEIAVSIAVTNCDFHGPGWRTIGAAWREEVRNWLARGIRTIRFLRVEETPPGFWERLLRSARSEYPDAVFLAESTTSASEKLQHALARSGFSQMRAPLDGSESKTKLKKSIFDLSRPELRDHFRACLWPTFPKSRVRLSVLKTRIALAAALSSAWGIDDQWLFGEAGYEALGPFVTQINHIRNTNAAMCDPVHPLVCHSPDRDVLCLLKSVEGNSILVVLNLGEAEEEFEATIQFPRATDYDQFIVRDLFTGKAQPWHGARRKLKLDGGSRVVRIFRVEK